MTEIRYVSSAGTFLVKRRGNGPEDTGSVQLLLGARLHVDPADNAGGLVAAATMPDKDGNCRTGFVDRGTYFPIDNS